MSKAVDYVNSQTEFSNTAITMHDKVVSTIFESGYLNPHEVAKVLALILEDLEADTAVSDLQASDVPSQAEATLRRKK